MNKHFEKNPKNQQGATLIVALILLLVMSIIAITSMSTSVLEEKMAVNLQNYVNVFQVAESGIDQSINDISVLQAVRSAANTQTVNPSLGTTSSAVASVEISFVKEDVFEDGDTPDATKAGGSWEGGGAGNSSTSTRYFEAESNAHLVGNTNIKTKLTQGFYYCPECQ